LRRHWPVYAWVLATLAVTSPISGYDLLGAIAGIRSRTTICAKGELSGRPVPPQWRYEYSGGWNIHALIAALAPCLPGYLVVSGVLDRASVAAPLVSLFDFGWFFSLAVAGSYYLITAKRTSSLTLSGARS
jgi:NCS1 family nucleobase:cation symporter-1